MLSIFLQRQHHIQAATLGKGAEGDTRSWSPIHAWETQKKLQAPGFRPTQTDSGETVAAILGSETVNGRHSPTSLLC